ncbi:MAG: nucleotide exchange factor GrpE [Bacteroidales bacterium]|jgi:molecular chaperone GrpE|nr:nucleotide exchange factor GrpE [Bacteroidales bacterium]
MDIKENKEQKENQESKINTPEETSGAAAAAEKTEDKMETEQKNENDKASAGEENEDMNKQLESLQKERDDYKDKYLRLAAEFDNYRRRTARERIDLISTAAEDTIKGLLPVLDDCERAMELLRKSDDSSAAKEGTELIYGKLKGYLQSKGLEEIESLGKDLDTDFHEAVSKMPVKDKKQKNKVINVLQQGYKLNGKIIRYAKVVVGD